MIRMPPIPETYVPPESRVYRWGATVGQGKKSKSKSNLIMIAGVYGWPFYRFKVLRSQNSKDPTPWWICYYNPRGDWLPCCPWTLGEPRPHFEGRG